MEEKGEDTCHRQSVELIHVFKEFDGENVLNDINLEIKEHEFVTLLGLRLR